MSGSTGLMLLIGVLVLIGIFLLCRKFWCWYWKINRVVALLESIDESLRQLPAVRTHDDQGQRTHAA